MELTRLSKLRPRDVWGVLDDAFDLYRARFALLAGIAAVPFVPSYLLNTLVTTLAYKRFQESAESAQATEALIPLLIFFGAMAVGQPILLIARAIQYAATSVAIEDWLTGTEPSARRAWKQTAPHLFTIAFAVLGIVLLIALIYLISCGALIFLGLPFMALIPICIVLEKRGLKNGFRRGWRLALADFGRGLGLSSLVWMLEVALQIGLGMLVGAVFSLIPGQKVDLESTGSYVTGQVAQAVTALFIAPLGGVATTLFYFDCRVRREGLDLTALAQETDVTLAEAPQ